MAAPASVDIHNLSGVFVMNKTLSDPSDPPLTLQGISWLTRKAIGLATITLTISHTKNADGFDQIDIDQVGTGGIKGTTENRTLNNVEKTHTDHIFGEVTGTSYWTKLSEVTDDFLKNGWLPESQEGDVISTNVVNKKDGWSAKQIWGFEQVNGERRYVRHALVEKDGKRVDTRLVYDYKGPKP